MRTRILKTKLEEKEPLQQFSFIICHEDGMVCQVGKPLTWKSTHVNDKAIRVHVCASLKAFMEKTF